MFIYSHYSGRHATKHEILNVLAAGGKWVTQMSGACVLVFPTLVRSALSLLVMSASIAVRDLAWEA